MTTIKRLDPKQLRTTCDPRGFNFKTTAEITELIGFIGQEKAIDAANFGIKIHHHGYNIFALGPAGIGKHLILKTQIEQEAQKRNPAPDLCYIHNFKQPRHPIAIKLPPGIGKQLGNDMQLLVEELQTSIPAMIEGEDYRARIKDIVEDIKKQQDQEFSKLQKKAEDSHLTIVRTAHGFAVAPTVKGELMTDQEFAALPKEEKRRKEQQIEDFQEKLAKFLEQIPVWHKEQRERERKVSRASTMIAVGSVISGFKKKYDGLTEVLNYLDEVERDIIENAQDFRRPDASPMNALGLPQMEKPSFARYRVNVLVDNSTHDGAPVLFEQNPTHSNLVGRIDQISQFGTLVTDLTMVRPGALHKANGGYLMLDAVKVLSQPYAWEGIKRALQSNTILIENFGQMMGLMATVSLEPTPFELDIKIVLFGDRYIYYLLCAFDPEFLELFKVAADFQDEMTRDPDTDYLFARFVATIAKKESLRPLDPPAVASVIEHASRLVGDAKRLSMQMRKITDLLSEANFVADKNQHKIITRSDVEAAIEHQVARVDRIKQRMFEEIERGTILIATSGQQAGQVNCLSVSQLGDFMFGQPSRITASVHLGSGEVIDIEREVKLGGPIHSKGVFILYGFLSGRFAKERTLSLSASLVFEQTYGTVEGDSASVAELCALLSALGNIPVYQSLAITGSVNQHGQVQAIGGVNEKIEGFFDVCKARGLTGDQGVIIPKSNLDHLMLRNDVVKAATDKMFHIYAVETVDEAISLLTGLKAGERNKKGEFTKGSVNYIVEHALIKYSKRAKRK